MSNLEALEMAIEQSVENAAMVDRINMIISEYEDLINDDEVSLSRKLEVAEILKLLFYVRDGGEFVSTILKYNIKIPAKENFYESTQ